MPTLRRDLGIAGATAIGAASMLGAGIFFVWAPATAVAGGAVLIALPLAAAIAALNAASTIRLAMRHPVAGGAYAYGRAEVNQTTGFVAGVLYLAGKTASVAAIGLVAGAYVWPGGERVVAVGLVAVLVLLNVTGVRTTAWVSAAIAAVVVSALVIVLVTGAVRAPIAPAAVVWPTPDIASVGGVLSAAALIFFAFAGYARIATLGEEVRDPRRTLPRAALLSIVVVLLLAAATLLILLLLLGTEGLSTSASPLAEIAGGAEPVVRGVVALACAGSMVGVLAGMSRTGMAMARDGELPPQLALISRRWSTPLGADIAVAVLAVAAALLLDPVTVVGISACAVLGYYAIAHIAAIRAGRPLGLPRAVPIAGLVGCLVVGLSTPPVAVLLVTGMLLVALGTRALVRRRDRGTEQ